MNRLTRSVIEFIEYTGDGLDYVMNAVAAHGAENVGLTKLLASYHCKLFIKANRLAAVAAFINVVKDYDSVSDYLNTLPCIREKRVSEADFLACFMCDTEQEYFNHVGLWCLDIAAQDYVQTKQNESN